MSLRVAPQTPLRPKSYDNQHECYCNPESGIELDLGPAGKLAAENCFPLVPVEKDAKRVQALQQTESGRQEKQQYQYPAQNAGFFGGFRKLAGVKRARRIAHHGRRQQAYARARRDDRNHDKSRCANDSYNKTCGQHIHSSTPPCVGAYDRRDRIKLREQCRYFQGGNDDLGRLLSLGESHSSKNTTFMSGRTRAPAGCLAMCAISPSGLLKILSRKASTAPFGQ